MLDAPRGKFRVKIEFEDDSFEHTDAELLPENRFQCRVKSAAGATAFKMLFLTDEGLQQFRCVAEKAEQKDLVSGTLLPLDN